MKVCETCGDEISTRDGHNECASCERHSGCLKAKRKSSNQMDDAMRSLGLVKVRGAMGGVYWE